MFKKATKQESRLRLGLCGPTGSGKTYSALAIGTALGKVAYVDTEHGSAAKYSDTFEFDVVNLDSFEPVRFIQAIKAAELGGYDVVVLDSLSHAWMGTGGILSQVDEAKRRTKNDFGAWRDASAEHTALIESIVHARVHVIATMRSKMEYVLEEDERGRKIPRKLGMAPVQREGMEYEFDVVGDMDQGRLVVTKSRCPLLTDKSFKHPGADVAAILREWLHGEPVPMATATPAPTHAGPSQDASDEFKAACAELGMDARATAADVVKSCGVSGWSRVTDSMLRGYIRLAREHRAAAQPTHVGEVAAEIVAAITQPEPVQADLAV